MGYQIQYGQTMVKRKVIDHETDVNKPPLVKWIIISMVILVAVFLGNSGYLDFIIPGDKDITTAAFSAMIKDVQEGESINEAITAFCLEILDNGNAAN